MTFSLESWNIELILLLLIIITSTGWAILTQGAPHTTDIIPQALHPDKLLCSFLWTTLFCCATSPTQASEAPKVGFLLSWSLEYTEGKLIQTIQPLCNKRSFLPSRQSFRDWKRTTQHAFLTTKPPLPVRLQIWINTLYRDPTAEPFLGSDFPGGDTDLSTQQSTIRWVGTLVGLSIAGVSDRIQARNALIRRFLSSTALPSHSFLRFGQVHSLKARASTSSGVWGDLPL